MKKTISLLLALALLTLPFPVHAVSPYSDLPDSHWAYRDMDRAVQLGIIYGVGGNAMAPQGTLTWAQFLAMLCRAFYPDDYRARTDMGDEWDAAGYQIALQRGYLMPDDFLPVSRETLGEPITRQQTAVLLDRILPRSTEPDTTYGEPIDERWIELFGDDRHDPYSDSAAYSIADYYEIDRYCRDSVARLFDLGIVRGKDDGTFGPGDTLQRCDGTVLLMRVLDQADSLNAGETVTVMITMEDEYGAVVVYNLIAEVRTGDTLYSVVYQNLPAGYEMDESIRDIKVRSTRRDYTVTIRHKSRAEMDQDAAWEAYQNGEITYDEMIMMDFWLTTQGPSYRKNQLLFGDRDRDFFESRAEADANMTTVTVPVWRLEGGSKVSGTAGVTVHKALADEVLAIFTEIYNDPEQFPIHDLGGYSWRGVGVSEHSSGTAIDINSDQNCQMKGGTVVAGSYWKPGEDPYSIPADGSVVRIFRAHGWTWGGAAWESSVDYMHFSYLGM